MASEGRRGNGREKYGSGEYCFMLSEGDRRHCNKDKDKDLPRIA